MEANKYLNLISPGKELKKCNGDGCKGGLKLLSDFYTKGKGKDGRPRYENICKRCKSIKGKARRRKLKKAKKSVNKTRIINVYECDFEISFSDDHVKQDLERYLLDFAMDLIFELEEADEK